MLCFYIVDFVASDRWKNIIFSTRPERAVVSNPWRRLGLGTIKYIFFALKGQLKKGINNNNLYQHKGCYLWKRLSCPFRAHFQNSLVFT